MKVIYLDGQFLKVNAQVLDVYAPGVFKGNGVFETMLGLDGVVLDTDLHLKRLQAGLKELGIKAPKINPSVLKQVLERNQLTSGRVRLMVWQTGKEIHTLIAALPYKGPAKHPYKVCLIKTKREAQDRHAQMKSLDYEIFSNAYAKAQSQGFDEALLLNKDGYIFEASRANIFWIKDKILCTPPLSSGCLSGITRQQVIKQAKSLKIVVKEMNLTPKILKEADAAFLTNSLIGIKPIDINEIKIAS